MYSYVYSESTGSPREKANSEMFSKIYSQVIRDRDGPFVPTVDRLTDSRTQGAEAESLEIESNRQNDARASLRSCSDSRSDRAMPG